MIPHKIQTVDVAAAALPPKAAPVVATVAQAQVPIINADKLLKQAFQVYKWSLHQKSTSNFFDFLKFAASIYPWVLQIL